MAAKKSSKKSSKEMSKKSKQSSTDKNKDKKTSQGLDMDKTADYRNADESGIKLNEI